MISRSAGEMAILTPGSGSFVVVFPLLASLGFALSWAIAWTQTPSASAQINRPNRVLFINVNQCLFSDSARHQNSGRLTTESDSPFSAAGDPDTW
jgi:hypothetical protein